MTAVAITLVVITVTSFVLRAYVRTQMVKAFGLDDWFMMVATITFILFATCVMVGVHHGTGQLYADVTHANYAFAMKYWLYCYIWYCWTMILSKISIAIFLLRIIVEKIHLWLIYVALFINVLSGLVFFFVTLLQCHPLTYFWEQYLPDKVGSGSCISSDIIIALTYLYSSLNIICDFTFALLPIVIVKGLNMNKRLKIAIIPLLSMGCIASSAVVVRLAYVQTFADREYLSIWSTVEAGLAVTAGSLACIRPLFKLLMQRLGGLSDVYFHPSLPLGGGRPRNTTPGLGTTGTIGTTGGTHSRKERRGDMFSMSMFSRNDDADDLSDHSDGTASTRKLVVVGGIVKTSAFEVKVEERTSDSETGKGDSSRNREDVERGLPRNHGGHEGP
ncbi:hypothetical protein SLS53_001738 [Cytospora paraplurivora]|uniref:Rhodopsin domain-containing protein n=1 Tax=Cytospora paraplurivora TaxID=2898453 RepID=A0AAN9YJL6_9PEZI